MEPSSPGFEVMTSIRSDAILKSSISNTKLSFMDRPSQFYMISYHYDRMVGAATQFRWFKAVKSFESESGIAQLESALEQHLHDTYGRADYAFPLKVKCHIWLPPSPDAILMRALHKIRVLLDHQGKLNITSTPTPPASTRELFPSELWHLPLLEKSGTWRIFVSRQRIAPSQYTTHKTTNRAVYDNARAALLSASERSALSEVLLVNTDRNVMEGTITTPYFYRRRRWVTPPAAHGGNVGTTRRWALEKGLCIEEAVPVDSLELGERIWLSNGVRGWVWGHLEALGLPEPSNLQGVATTV